jgi:general secretion pathway protein N
MTGRRLAFYGATGALIYAAALVATIPAPWVSRAVAQISGEKLQLREPEGTLWSGSGHLYAVPRAGALLELGSLRWRTSRSAVLAARLEIEATLDDAPKATRIQLAPSGTTIRGLELTLPAEIVATFAPALDTLGPAGVLRVRSDDLRFEGPSVLGLAELEWRRVRLARAPGIDLGSHLARLRGGGSKVDIELSTIDGPLRLSGHGTWSRDAGLKMSGAIDQDAPRTAPLARFLEGICTQYRNNGCQFQIGR